eukprot:TRINITY_DN13150_c0_g1_i1.p1 TRINITY_DN13150_c0_g1~~TRINITY_DN13150_c0_g1_i1.p1  ORF type:complete len:322 (+),score=82.74 TRINITY_DN13150_c0_g1_i1:65-967(+)
MVGAPPRPLSAAACAPAPPAGRTPAYTPRTPHGAPAPARRVLTRHRRKLLCRGWAAQLSQLLCGELVARLWDLYESLDTNADGCVSGPEFEQFLEAAFHIAGVPLPPDQTTGAMVRSALYEAGAELGSQAPAVTLTAEQVARALARSPLPLLVRPRWRPLREELWEPGGPPLLTLRRLQQLREAGREGDLAAMLLPDVEWTWAPMPAERGAALVAQQLVRAHGEEGGLARDWRRDPETDAGGWTRIAQRKVRVGTVVATTRVTVWLTSEGYVARGATAKDIETPPARARPLRMLLENALL